MRYFLGVFIFLFIGIIPCYSKGGGESMRGNGNAISQERTVIDFDGVILVGVANINIHFGDTYKVIVSADSNLQEYVTTSVSNNLLYIDTDTEIESKNEIQIDVYMPGIKSIALKGVGNIILDNGDSANMEIILSGVGIVDAQNYHVEELAINLSGTGNIKVWAKKINGTSSGVVNILYKDVPLMNFKQSGIGKIEKM